MRVASHLARTGIVSWQRDGREKMVKKERKLTLSLLVGSTTVTVRDTYYMQIAATGITSTGFFRNEAG